MRIYTLTAGLCLIAGACAEDTSTSDPARVTPEYACVQVVESAPNVFTLEAVSILDRCASYESHNNASCSLTEQDDGTIVLETFGEVVDVPSERPACATWVQAVSSQA